MNARRHFSQVNWRKIIEDFRSGYQLKAAWEIVLIELIANSIDAGATGIDVSLEGTAPKVIRVADDGKGMNRLEFSQYHNLGSLTKTKGSGIGWAGVGAKLYLDRCTAVYTETRSETFEGASKWFLPRGQKGPVWDDVPSRRLVGGSRGTAVEILVADRRECKRISVQQCKSVILFHFNYALRPHGEIVLRVNGERVEAFDPASSAETSKEVELRLRNGSTVAASFILLREAVPSGFGLIALVVHGKTIGESYDFHQGARIREPRRISGYVRCDSLIKIVTTSKDSFNRKTMLWKDFDVKVGRQFSEWLREIGQLETPGPGNQHDALLKRVQSNLNRIFDLPEVRKLQVDPFQTTTRRRTPIADPAGDQAGTEVLGQQLAEGTGAGPEEDGQRVRVLGDDFGTSVLTDEHGTTRVSEEERTIRTGVKVEVMSFPGRNEAAWMDPADQAIMINDLYPAFLCADSTGASEFYVIETCFQILSKFKEDEAERQTVFARLFELYLSVNPTLAVGR